MAKAANWTIIDAQARKRGEQTGLDTLVVHALNDVCLLSGFQSSGSWNQKTENFSDLKFRVQVSGIPVTERKR